MKINREYKDSNTNISASSYQSIEEFQKKRIQTNIILHKCFLTITIIINITLIFFICFYKKKLSELKSLSSQYSTQINSEDESVCSQRSTIDHKIVNIGANSYRGGFLFSYLFKNVEELEKVKKMIKDYYIEEKKSNQEFTNFYPGLIYQSFTHGSTYHNFFDEISDKDKIVVMIETEENERFGVFIGNYIDNSQNGDKSDNKNNEDIDDSKDEKNENNKLNDVFIFSLQNDSIFKYKGNGNAVSFSKKKMLTIGNDEIVIFDNFYDNGATIDFPLKSFECSYGENKPFIKNNGNFKVRYIEAFKFFE